MSNELLYEVSDGIAVITINRPERKNAINRAVRQALFDVWPRFEADDSAQIAILTGTGDTFCAGMDLIEALTRCCVSRPRTSCPCWATTSRSASP
jgi:enoyl-CoA hydratase